jgi:hypothetical protein
MSADELDQALERALDARPEMREAIEALREMRPDLDSTARVLRDVDGQGMLAYTSTLSYTGSL